MTGRVVTDGKVLALDGSPWRVRGVTYGSFVTRLDGEPFPERAQVKEDFRRMAECGLNTVRTYELPPVDVLDLACEYGLQVLVGLHYHDWRMERRPSRSTRHKIREAGLHAVADAVERCGERSNILAIAVGNEVPNDIVRVHGIAAVEDTLSELVESVHARSDLLATYVNFPTTEFLDVGDQNLSCFNVFLEDPDTFRQYLRHLQVVSGDRPLVITELGLPSIVHGEAEQASSLDWQLRGVDEAGCAGATVFAWTDEWGVNDESVGGWGFGVTDPHRQAKPALEVVEEWTRRPLVALRDQWPHVSVIVCAYNEESTIEECLESLARTTYPHLEVVVCDDGSTDRTLEIARRFPFRILELSHGGLSRARNAGLEAASGGIVAYLDADAYCHPEWPLRLVLSFDDTNVAATGGPNLPVPGAGFVERAVALSPGAPLEVLMSDDRAEHVPGCNMAYRRHELEAIGGFDPVYTAAGDDVDVCWKLLERGREIAFAHAAQVRHHRRASVKGYLRQQRGYGKAEKLLAGAHPHRFNRFGQARWSGVIYGGAPILPRLLRPIVYHGYQGGAPFQPVARRRAELANMWSAALLPEALLVAAVGTLAGLVATPWWLLVPTAIAVAIVLYAVAVAAAVNVPRAEPHPLRLRFAVGILHVLQPYWRAFGRLRGARPAGRALGHPAWSGNRWTWLQCLESDLRARGCRVRTGGPNHSWDLEASVGPFVGVRVTTAVMWGWEPQLRLSYRARPMLWLVLGILGVSAMVLTPATWIVCGILLALVLAESMSLRRRIVAAVEATVQRSTA